MRVTSLNEGVVIRQCHDLPENIGCNGVAFLAAGNDEDEFAHSSITELSPISQLALPR
jgi:hypothetical protein